MKKIIILDYSTSEVHVYECPEGDDEHYEDWITTHTSHKLSETIWMISNLLTIKIH